MADTMGQITKAVVHTRNGKDIACERLPAEKI